jgi:hypothetical protein
MSHGETISQELKPSEKPLQEDGCGPAKVPAVSNSCGIPFPNLHKICKKDTVTTL